MIEQLKRSGLLSVVGSSYGLIGYVFKGDLHETYEELNSSILKIISSKTHVEHHSCPTMIPSEVLHKIGYFSSLPSIPFHAYPHNTDATTRTEKFGDWVLNPSTCYHTFAHLADSAQDASLKYFTARGNCHRFEPSLREPTRLASFTMREFVLLGLQTEVELAIDSLLDTSLRFLRRISPSVAVEAASDVFYGDSSSASRKVQLALGVKQEILIPWIDGTNVSIGSRNYHRDVFTKAFGIKSLSNDVALHSACLAFGMERLLLTLLASSGLEAKALTSAITEARKYELM